ncbi:hypothetical protein DL764_001440 [Monosporascus ibericus]|uniref:Amino acid permease/ SLC12A domain-containing protein n=1 Tax=Monosporascus ibericus TaxID=155417 RepID=A0A4V1XCB5_9PEZI|nr:hypothetical protein DL764_001440 [Monosporascus ibericus]
MTYNSQSSNSGAPGPDRPSAGACTAILTSCAWCPMPLMATWEALSTVISAALANGVTKLDLSILSFLSTICIAASMGEIASIYPTAGGQYHWVAALCPAAARSAASWITGWISIGGQIVLTASAAFAAGLQAQSLIILNSNYAPTRWQGMLFYWAVLAYAAVLNIWGARLMPHVNLVMGITHIVAFVGIIVTISAMSSKNTTSFVFTEVVNSSGWGSTGVSWLVGLQSAVYPLLGYDAACHLAEELPHASLHVPQAMVGSVLINGLMGLAYAIVLLYSAGSLKSLLETPTGFPFMQIYLDATQSRAGTTVMSIMLIIVATAATVAGVASSSRTLWAFARDRATPFDSYLSAVNAKAQIPVRAVVVVTVLQILLGLIYLGNTTAFNAVLSMAIIGNYLSYGSPIACMLLYGRSTLQRSDYGPFRMPLALADLTAMPFPKTPNGFGNSPPTLLAQLLAPLTAFCWKPMLFQAPTCCSGLAVFIKKGGFLR